MGYLYHHLAQIELGSLNPVAVHVEAWLASEVPTDRLVIWIGSPLPRIAGPVLGLHVDSHFSCVSSCHVFVFVVVSCLAEDDVMRQASGRIYFVVRQDVT